MTDGVETTLPAQPASERPFYFIVVLWGERFRNYFLDYCLASALSPGNIPALRPSRPSKFLIATRPEDWEAMRRSELFQLMERYVESVYIEIPPCPPGMSGCQHMGTGHRIACDMAHRDKAYAMVLTPDCMLSDGSVARLQELADRGTHLVLTAALRFGEEPFLGHFEKLGVIGGKSRGTPLAITGRQMVYAAVNGFHSETLAYEWDAPGLMVISPAAWWRVPGEDGIVLHSLSWAPLLLDYSAIESHDTSTFDQWTLDGDYLFNNSKEMTRIHVVQDSDEVFLASWGPMAERPVSKGRFPFDYRLAGHFFRQSFYSGFFDPLKRELFFLPVRWHSQPLNEQWAEVEARAAVELRRWVEPPSDKKVADTAQSPSLAGRLGGTIASLPMMSLRTVAYAWMFRRSIARYLLRIAKGDVAALERMFWLARTFMFGSGHSSGKLS